jgi:hypothetical protein
MLELSEDRSAYSSEELTVIFDDWKAAATELLTRCPGSSDVQAPEIAEDESAPALSLADEISAEFPGYPLLVNVQSLDYRVANWFEGKLVDGQVVALLPGVYAPYNPQVEDLSAYYESGGAYGDSIMKEAYLPNSGGATWSGVLPGAEEPQ